MRLPRLHRPRPVAWLAIALVLLAVFVVVQPHAVFAQPLLPLTPASENADVIAQLFTFVLWLAVGVFVLVEGLIIYSVVRFRQRPGDSNEDPVQIYGNTQLEIAWTVVPALLVLTILILSLQAMPVLYNIPGDTVASASADVGVCYVGSLSTDQVTRAAGTDLIVVKVIGHQWWWEFEYPQYGFKTATQLAAPAGRVVKLELTAADVMHGWWVPELGPQFNVTPGYVNESWFQATRPRTYQGQCSMHCGTGHPYMPLEVVALPQADFDRWADQQSQPRAEPATALAQQGEQLFATRACITCHAIDGYPGNKAVALRGPNLTHFGSRSYVGAYLPNTRENLAHWLRNSSEIKPGNIMATVIRLARSAKLISPHLASISENLK